jgi:MFS family permease
MNEFIHYDVYKPKRPQVSDMPKFSTPLAFSPIAPGSLSLSRNPLFNFMQKLSAYSATIFISTLPFIGRLMHSSGNHIQLTLTVFFVGSIVGELLAGPLSKMIGCKHIFLLGAAFYLASAVVIRCSTVPSLLLAARVVQAIGAMASIAVTLYSFYTAAPVLPIKAIANPAGSFRHLFIVLTFGIVIGGLSTRVTHAAFLLLSLPAAITSFFRPLLQRLTASMRATTFGAAMLARGVRRRDDGPLLCPDSSKVAHIYARSEFREIYSTKRD